MEKTSDIIETRKNKLSELREQNINPFPNDFKVLHTVEDIRRTIENSPEGAITENAPVFVAAGQLRKMLRYLLPRGV